MKTHFVVIRLDDGETYEVATLQGGFTDKSKYAPQLRGKRRFIIGEYDFGPNGKHAAAAIEEINKSVPVDEDNLPVQIDTNNLFVNFIREDELEARDAFVNEMQRRVVEIVEAVEKLDRKRGSLLNVGSKLEDAIQQIMDGV